MATAIEFNHVGKQYRLGLVSTRTLSHDLNRWWHTAILKQEDPYLRIGEVNDRTTAANHSQYVWALRDIDFKVEQGDVVGIIGKNGAGKSTLLKLLSKVTGPTVGTIRARGRIGALLEVGTGFHPEMTGRENIYMNGAIMGMNKSEISKKLDEIVEFSGCERYIDTPVKRYSSGMTVRLSFAVAAHLDPEILVVDEVLAVGDAEFQKKAICKMQDVSKGEGRTVLFVSHNMASVRALCNKCILLENGTVKDIGPTDTIIGEYIVNNNSTKSYDFDSIDRTLPNRIVSFKILNSEGIESYQIFTGGRFFVEIGVQNVEYDDSIGIGLYFSDIYGVRIAGCTSFSGKVIRDSDKKSISKVIVEIPSMVLTEGKYNVSLTLVKKNYATYDSIENVAAVTVEPSLLNVGKYLGHTYFDSIWTIE